MIKIIKIFTFICSPFDLLKSTNSNGQWRDRARSHPDFTFLGFVPEFVGLKTNFIFESSNPFRDLKSRVDHTQIKEIGHDEPKHGYDDFRIVSLTKLPNEDVARNGTCGEETKLSNDPALGWTVIKEKYLSLGYLHVFQCWAESIVEFFSWLLLRLLTARRKSVSGLPLI